MRRYESDDRLELSDPPGCIVLFGALFVLSGTAAIVLPWLAIGSPEWTGMNVLVGTGIGAAHLAAGLWVVLGARGTTTVLDRETGEGTVTVHGVRAPPRTETFALADVRFVELEESRGSENERQWQIHLWLADSRRLALHQQPGVSRPHVREAAEHVARFLGLPEPTLTTRR